MGLGLGSLGFIEFVRLNQQCSQTKLKNAKLSGSRL